ncbi:MAG: DnaA/Hda family protein [Rubripirellula sp.]|nr:DnaA/Hda family protein [Rubripirellula sp.]
MATATGTAATVHSFPLERPSARVRKRTAPIQGGSLPYFIAGDENRMVRFVASAEGSVFGLGNPLLLVGPSGSGKTAIALHLAARESSRSNTGEPTPVLYYPAVDFARLYAEAVGADDLPPLRQEISEAPILVIDDLHLINDKSAAQDELAARIEDRVTRGLPTLLACKRLPSEIRGMRPLLVSRVLPGLTIPLEMPTGAARSQLLREIAVHLGLEIDSDLIDSLDQKLEPRIPTRALEAALKQVSLWCRMNEAAPNEDAIASAIMVVGQRQEISLAAISNTVAKYFRLKVADLRSSSRKQNLVRARSLSMFMARQMTSKSMHQIGEYFGGRDHTTVLHAIRKTQVLLESDTDLQRAAEDVREKFCET